MKKQPGPKKKVVAKTKKPSSTGKPKEDVATAVMMAPGRAFAKGMGYMLNTTEKYGNALRSKIHKATAPTTKKPKK